MAEETAIPEPEIVKISVFTPLIYVGVVLTIFIAFSINYRKRRLASLTKVTPLFKENYNAMLYQELKAQYINKDLPKEQRPHEKVMKAALLRRAVEAIRRSMKLKENEPIFNKLYQLGLIGDDIFKQFEIQAKFQELELKEIVQECETYKKGWVQTFFPTAQDICFNEALRRRLNAMEGREKDLAEFWDYFVGKSEESLDDKKQVKKASKETKKIESTPKEQQEKVEEPVVADLEAEGEDEEEESPEHEEHEEQDDEKKENHSKSTNPKKKKKGGKGKKK